MGQKVSCLVEFGLSAEEDDDVDDDDNGRKSKTASEKWRGRDLILGTNSNFRYRGETKVTYGQARTRPFIILYMSQV